jgi:hypothetical protein
MRASPTDSVAGSVADSVAGSVADQSADQSNDERNPFANLPFSKRHERLPDGFPQ